MLLDEKQKIAEKICNEFALLLKPRSLFARFSKYFFKDQNFSGIYMYGGVGRGKTMLMKRFYEKVSLPKEIIHFQKFMQDLHIKLHSIRKKSREKLIDDLAFDIAKRSRVICLDEFEIKDISDAMIIMRLFSCLKKHDVFIFMTTNIPPDYLYKDGIQRESFLPFIDMIHRKFQIIHLDSSKDYRYNLLSTNLNRILYPANLDTNKQIAKIKEDICDKAELSKTSIEIFGRKIDFNFAHQRILFTNFDEMFQRDLGYADYVNICEHFSIIVLENVRLINEDEVNIITRFINFVDNAYFNKVLLFMELDYSLEKIYPKGNKLPEFTRTISRLNEMNSSEYLK